MLHLCHSMPDPGSPETLDESAETSDDDRENTFELVPEWRPEYEVPTPEPGDPGMTRRRIVEKRHPNDDEEEEKRQKRLRSELVPELFPLTGEELTENIFEILIDLFASPEPEHCEDSRVSNCSEHCEDSRVSDGSEQCEGSRVPEDYVYTQDRDRFRPLKRRAEVSLRDLSCEDRDAFNRAKQKGVGFVA